MMSNREDMIAEAIDLGLDFKGNISNKKLAAMIDEANEAPLGDDPVVERAPPGPAVKAEHQEEDDEVVESARDIVMRRRESAHAKKRREIAVAKNKAMATSIVTITNKDSRENETVTSAYLSVQNLYFARSRYVPLDVPIELEHCLIRNAESCMVTIHRDEMKNGRPTGNKVTRRVPKYTVSHSPIEPK